MNVAITTVARVLQEPIAEMIEAEYDSILGINSKAAFHPLTKDQLPAHLIHGAAHPKAWAGSDLAA